jgi:hypothetical protein
MTTSRTSKGNQSLFQKPRTSPHCLGCESRTVNHNSNIPVRYSSSTDSPTVKFNLPIFMRKELFVSEYIIGYALGQILKSNTNSNGEVHMSVSR